MSKRTDLHRPSAIIPTDYRFVACDYFGGGLEAMGFIGERMMFREHMKKTGGRHAHITREGADAEDGSFGCDVCGARIMYAARFHHVPSNTYLTTGMDCADKMDIGDPRAFASFRKRVAAGLKTQRGLLKAHDICVEHGILAAFELQRAIAANGSLMYDEARGRCFYEEEKIYSIVSKVIQYGNISEGQIKFVASLLAKINDRARVATERAVKDENRANIPHVDKRLTIEGVILSAKYEPSHYDSGFFAAACVKVVVEHETGWKVWGRLPADLWSGTVKYGEPTWNNGSMVDDGAHVEESKLKGRKVKFDCRIVPSDKDPKFGFFKRPTKASWVSESPAA